MPNTVQPMAPKRFAGADLAIPIQVPHAGKFPQSSLKFPQLSQKIPVPSQREFRCKLLNSLDEYSQDSQHRPRIRKIPVRIPAQRGIRRWRPVRSGLHPPPRSPLFVEISRLLAKSPELAGLCASALSLQRVKWILGSVSGLLSLASKSRFPATETGVGRDRFESAISLRRKA